MRLSIYPGSGVQIVTELCELSRQRSTDRSLISLDTTPAPAGTSDIESCLYDSPVLQAAVTVLLPALLLYLWQALVLPRVFYASALIEKAYTSLSSVDRCYPRACLHSSGGCMRMCGVSACNRSHMHSGSAC